MKPKTATKKNEKTEAQIDQGERLATSMTGAFFYELRRFKTRLLLLRAPNQGSRATAEWRTMAEVYTAEDARALNFLAATMLASAVQDPLPAMGSVKVKSAEVPEYASRRTPEYVDVSGAVEISSAQSGDKQYEAYRNGERIDLVIGYPNYQHGMADGVDRFLFEQISEADEARCLYSVLGGVLGHMKNNPLARDAGFPPPNKANAVTTRRGPDDGKPQRKGKAPKRTVFIRIKERVMGGFMATADDPQYTGIFGFAKSKNDAFEQIHEKLKRAYPNEQVTTRLAKDQEVKNVNMQTTAIVGKAPKAGTAIGKVLNTEGARPVELRKGARVVVGAYVYPEGDGFIAQTMPGYPDLTDQGDTKEEALKNLKAGLQLLSPRTVVEVEEMRAPDGPSKPQKSATNAPGRRHASKPAKGPSKGKTGR